MQRICLVALALVVPMSVAAAIGGSASSDNSGATVDTRVNFDRDIRPILSNNCFKCHGPDEAKRQAGLRLDTEAGERAELKSGQRAVVPGKSHESALFARITATSSAERMPPPSTGKVLTPEQIALFKRWIDEGAEWRPHWSFVTVKRPTPPAVKNEAGIQNEIDRFVLARLEREGLQLSSPADRQTLIRRLSLDLTGLPPSPADVDAFLADTNPGAYERLVDRLLQSPRFGEHMARYWLDAVRYGDSHGLHFDNERSLWPYRDWVIDAFNRNLPFDQFTVEQLAGDLLPKPTREQLVATGFNRCNVTTSEGGSIEEEVLMRYAVDRTEAVSNVFLGLTLGCAVCHDHKFDPFTQKEFYELYAFFSSAADGAMDGNALLPPPIMKLASLEQELELKSFDDQIALGRRNIADMLARIPYADPANSAVADNSPDSATATVRAVEPKEYVWIDDELPRERKQGDTEWKFNAKDDGPVFSGNRATTRTANAVSQHFFTDASPTLRIGEGDKLFAHVFLDPANLPKTIMLQFNDGTWEHRAIWGEDLIPFGSGNSPGHRIVGPLPEAGKWVRLEVECQTVGLASGSALNGWAFTQYGGRVWWDRAGIVTRTPQGDGGFESLAEWEAYERTQTKSAVPKPVLDAIKAEPAKRTDDQKKQIRDYFLENVCPSTRPLFEPLKAQLETLSKQRAAVDSTIPSTMVMADLPEKRETFVRVRGAYNRKGEQVTAGVPAVLPSLPSGAPANRLGLAQWLVAPEQPLTARVNANRIWQQFFGRGLVATPNDFGSQGEWPSHPQLLDWLAAEFMAPMRQPGGSIALRIDESDESCDRDRTPDHAVRPPGRWDIKHLVRLIVTSSTYRQSSRVTPELVQRDPQNVLLARGPRFRMDAEVIRDAALASSGLLIEQIGGRSVKPYQPPGLWEAVGFLGSNTREYKQDSGAGLYRRSLYTFWKRTSPPAQLTTFDAPTRETCTLARPRTNTPLQALALMNDDQYVEAARQLAKRVILASSNTGDRLIYGFRLCTARAPAARELEVLEQLYGQQLEHYRANREAAVKLLTVGESTRDESLDPSEHAAWTMIANLLLNLDETITKE